MIDELIMAKDAEQYFLFLQKTGRKIFPRRLLDNIKQLKGLNPKKVQIIILPGASGAKANISELMEEIQQKKFKIIYISEDNNGDSNVQKPTGNRKNKRKSSARRNNTSVSRKKKTVAKRN